MIFTAVTESLFLRTWCEQGAPYWILPTRSTGIRSRGPKVVLPTCSATLKTTPTPWLRMSGKPTWSLSPSSQTTWVSGNAVNTLLCQHAVKDNYACLHPWTLLLAVLTVDYLDVSDPERATLPRFEDISEAYPKELGSFVQFPQFSLRPQGHRGS